MAPRTRASRLWRGIAWLGIGLALGAAGLLVWLRSDDGRRFLAGRIERAVNERAPGRLSIGRLSGSLLDGARLERVRFVDERGQPVAEADAIAVRYRPWSLWRRHAIEELRVERPRVAVDRVRALAAARGAGGGWPALSIARVELSDGAIEIGGRKVEPIEVQGSLETGTEAGDGRQATGDGRWTEGAGWAGVRARASVQVKDRALTVRARGSMAGGEVAAELEELAGRAWERPLRVTGRVGGPLAALDGALDARLGASRVTGPLHVRHGRLDATWTAEVAPAEAALIHAHPHAPIRLAVVLHGPLHALDVRTRARLERARVTLTGRVDLPQRRGRVRFLARQVRPRRFLRHAPSLTFGGDFTLDGALVGRELRGRLSVVEGRLDVEGHAFDRLAGSSTVRLGQPGAAHVEALAGRMLRPYARPIWLTTDIDWNRAQLRFVTPRSLLGRTVLAGALTYRHPHGPEVEINAGVVALDPQLASELTHLRLRAPLCGQALLVWTPGLTRGRLTLATVAGVAVAEGELRHHGATVELPRVSLRLGRSHAEGAVVITRGATRQLTAAVDDAELTPELIHRLWPKLNPSEPVRVVGAAAGPLDALELRSVLTTGPSTLSLRGRLSTRTRRFHVIGALDSGKLSMLRPSQNRARLSLAVQLDGKLVPGGVDGQLRIRHAHGYAASNPFSRGRLDARLRGPAFEVLRARFEPPGAVIIGGGGGTYRDFRLHFSLIITDALELRQVPRSLRFLVGITHLVPGRSATGTLERHGGGKLVVTHRIIPPVIRELTFLFRLVTGRVGHH